MTAYCDKCGERFDAAGAWQKACWSCWRARKDAEQRASYDRGYGHGYMEGFVAGQRDGRQLPGVDPDLISRAVRLCHADRHPPERAAEANATTAALLELRQRVVA